MTRLYRRPAAWTATAGIMLICAVAAGGDRHTQLLVAGALPLGLLAVSVAIVTGRAGLPTLGQTAPFAVGAYATALLAQHHTTDALLQLAVAAGGGAVLAAVTGLLCLRARGTVFLMLTVAVGELATTAAGKLTSITGGTDGLAGLPATTIPGVGTLARNPAATLLFALTVTVAVTGTAGLLLAGRGGLLLDACRDNEARARACGHRAGLILWTAYTGAGAIAGAAGGLLVTVHRYITPSDVGFTTAALALLAVVIGGSGSLIGALAGTSLILAVRDAAAAPWPGSAPLLLGALFLAAEYLLPGGLAALPSRLTVPVRLRRRAVTGAGEP